MGADGQLVVLPDVEAVLVERQGVDAVEGRDALVVRDAATSYPRLAIALGDRLSDCAPLVMPPHACPCACRLARCHRPPRVSYGFQSCVPEKGTGSGKRYTGPHGVRQQRQAHDDSEHRASERAPEDRRSRIHVREILARPPHGTGTAAATPGLTRAYSRLSTSACRLASTMLSLTPTVPHSAVPSLDSISTRVRAAVPLVRIDDAHLVVGQLDVVRAAGSSGPSAARSAASSALTGPSPSATRCSDSSPTRTFTIASHDRRVAVAPHRHVVGVDDEGRRRVRQRACGSAAPASRPPIRTRSPGARAP